MAYCKIKHFGPPKIFGLATPLSPNIIAGRIQGGGDCPPQFCESNFIHHDFVEVGKQHSQLGLPDHLKFFQ